MAHPLATGHPAGTKAASANVRRDAVLWYLLPVLAFLVLGVALYNGPSPGLTRWAFGLAFLAVLSVLLARVLIRGTGDPRPLVLARAPGSYREGELTSLAELIERADSGLEYSQVVTASRAREAFAERARIALGLSETEVRALLEDPARLRTILGDEALADFMALPRGDPEAKERWVAAARGQFGFDVQFRRILDRMEAWR